MPRPLTPLISRRLAVETALQIIDEEGYETFSLEKLARRMHVKSPSLYHHFANKTDLLRATAFSLMLDIELPEPDPAKWQEWFIGLCVELHRRVLAHPRAAGLLFAYFPDDLTIEAHNRGMAILADQGFPVGVRWGVMRGLEKLAFGLALADAADEVSGRTHLPADEDRHRWPMLVEGVESTEFNAVELVEAAVRAYLTGAHALYATKAGKPRAVG